MAAITTLRPRVLLFTYHNMIEQVMVDQLPEQAILNLMEPVVRWRP